MDRDVMYCRDKNIFGKPEGFFLQRRPQIYFSGGNFVTRNASYFSIGGGIRSLRCANIYIMGNLKRIDILQRRYSALLSSEGNHSAALKIRWCY